MVPAPSLGSHPLPGQVTVSVLLPILQGPHEGCQLQASPSEVPLDCEPGRAGPALHLLSCLPRPGASHDLRPSCAFSLWWSLSLGGQHQGLGHLTPVSTEPLTWRQLPFPTVGQTSGQGGHMWPQVAPARESRAGQVLAQATVPRSEHVRRWQGLAAWVLSITSMGHLAWLMRKTASWVSKGGGLPPPRGHSGTKGIHQAVGRAWVGQAAAPAALRAKPTALSLLCLRAAGSRSCPRLGPACLSSPARRSWGLRSRASLEAVAPI